MVKYHEMYYTTSLFEIQVKMKIFRPLPMIPFAEQTAKSKMPAKIQHIIINLFISFFSFFTIH